MNSDDNIFGERLRELRKNIYNMPQKEFAELLGIPQPTISGYESGKIKPSLEVACRIAEKCDVSMNWICGGDDFFKVSNFGDVTNCMFGLFETKSFRLSHMQLHKDSVDIKISFETQKDNDTFVLAMIRVGEITNSLKDNHYIQDEYEDKKAYCIEKYQNIPVTEFPIITKEQHDIMTKRWLLDGSNEEDAIDK